MGEHIYWFFNEETFKCYPLDYKLLLFFPPLTIAEQGERKTELERYQRKLTNINVTDYVPKYHLIWVKCYARIRHQFFNEVTLKCYPCDNKL